MAETVNHRLSKTACLIVAALLAGAIFLGKLRLGSGDEPVSSQPESHSAAAGSSVSRQATPIPGGNRIMHRLPPILEPVDEYPRTIQFDEARQASRERPDNLHDGRRLLERGAIATWNQDPANHSKAVQLLARQDESRAAAGSARGLAARDSAGELPAPVNTDPVTLHLNEVNVRQALEMLSRSHGLSILIAPGVSGLITVNLEGLQVDEALDAIVKLGDLVAHREGKLIYVYSATEFPQANFQLHVFPLDFVSAIDVLPVVTNLLTPTGQATASSVSSTDNTKAREAVIVTDRPKVLERVSEFIRQIDIPPLQVMIEAHVLQIELGDDLKHGVNYSHAIDMLGSGGVAFELKGFADENASPSVLARINAKKIDGLLQFLKTTTNAKTLASPRVMVINGQKAHLQVGEKIPYLVKTVTETSLVETVEFLNVGVVLEVTPRISQDGRIMMRVKPKVSTGKFDAESKLPGEQTRELESDVILEDGLGMVIGGLIQEKDIEFQSKIPYLGDLHWVGRLFQRREVEKVRSEIVITLLPRICYSAEGIPVRDLVDAKRSQTPLLMGPLERFPRPWEPILPDAIDNPHRLHVPHFHRCRGCGHQPCNCEYDQSWDEGNKELTPTPVAPALAPPQQQTMLPAERQTTVPPAGPAPVYFQGMSAEEAVKAGFYLESHPPVPRTLP